MTMEFSAKEKFYLEHEKQIHEWKALEKGVPDLVDRFLEDLEGKHKEGVSRCAGSPKAEVVGSVQYPKLCLALPSWRRGNDKKPLCGIAFEWALNKPVHDKKGAYVGIWINRERINREGVSVEAKDLYRELRKPLEEKLKALKEEKNLKLGKGEVPWWPIKKYVERPRTFCEEPDAYAKQVIDSIHEVWDWAEPLLEEAIKSLKAP